MISLFYLLSATYWGWQIMARLRLSRNGIVHLCCAYLAGMLCSTWAAFMAALILKRNHWLPLLVISLLMLIHGLRMRRRKALRLRWRIEWPLFLFWLLLIVPNFGIGCLPDNEGNLCIMANYDDLCYHWAQIAHFTEPSRLSLDNPQAAGHPLIYHFLVNFHTSLLVRGGWSYLGALTVNQMALGTSMIVLLWFLFKVLLKKASSASLALVLLFCSHGGLGNIMAALSGQAVCGMFSAPPVTMSMAEKCAAWIDVVLADYFNFLNPMMNLLHPQRPFMAGLPLFAFALLLARAGMLRGRKGNCHMAAAFMVTGLMPLFHLHSFFFSAFIITAVTIVLRRRHHISLFSMAPLILIMPQFAFLSTSPQKDYSGWDVLSLPQFHENFNTGVAVIDHTVFWLRVGGLAALFGIPAFAIWILRSRKAQNSGHICSDSPVTAGMLLGLACVVAMNFYRLTPNWGDSNKFYFYYCLFASIVIASWWASAWKRHLLYRLAIVMTLTVSALIPYAVNYASEIISPSLSLARSIVCRREITEPFLSEEQSGPLHRHLRSFGILMSRGDRATGEWLHRTLPENAVMATSDDIFHYAAAITGHAVIDGAYTNETISGRDEIKEIIGEAYRKADFSVFRKLGASQVVVGPQERQRYHAIPSLWKKKPLYMRDFDGQTYYVFPADGDEPRHGTEESVWLSTLLPDHWKQDVCPPSFDQSIEKLPIYLEGKHIARGIGAHASSCITYSLNGEYESLSVVTGIDDSKRGGPGSVFFRITGDGRTLWESSLIKADGKTAAVKVSVRGISKLTLEVLDACDGNHCDHGTWGNALLERKKPSDRR